MCRLTIGEPGPHQHWVAGDQDAIAWHSGLRRKYNKSSLDFNNTYSVAWAVLSYAPTDKRSTHISHLSHWPRIKWSYLFIPATTVYSDPQCGVTAEN